MSTRGFEQIYLETHNWGKSVAFWQALGFKLTFETEHHSGQLVAPNGSRIFLNEQSPLDPLGMDLFLGVDQPITQAGLDVVHDWTATHWGTQVMTIRDPDGRSFRLEAPAEVRQ